MKATIEITLLFLGSIIGAGFATGAEIITFFGNFHLPIWCIALIIGISIFLMITFEVYLFYPKEGGKAFIQNPKRRIILDVVFVMIYLTLFTAMTAGITQITNTWFCLISLFISANIVLIGINQLTRFNFYLVLIIIILIITTALPRLPYTHLAEQQFQWNKLCPMSHWAILYAGLNCFMFPELITVLIKSHQRRRIIQAGLITAILVTVLVGLILTTIKSAGTEQASIPLLAAAHNPITITIILLAIVTSQYTALFAIVQRMQKILPTTKNKPQLTVTCICLCAFVGAFCGFNRIIKFGYPLIGAFTCFYLLISFLMKILHFLPHHQH